MENSTLFFKSKYAREVPIDYLIAFSSIFMPHVDVNGIRQYYTAKKLNTYTRKASKVFQYYICFMEAFRMKQAMIDIEKLLNVEIKFSGSKFAFVIGPHKNNTINTEIGEYDIVFVYSKHFTDDLLLMVSKDANEIISGVYDELEKIYPEINFKILYAPIVNPWILK